MDIAFVSLEDWDEVWRRNQFLCSHWVERHPADHIFYIQPALDVSNAVRRFRLRALFQKEKVQPHARITLYRPLKLLPNSFSWGRKFNAWLHRMGTRMALQRAGMTSPLLWINDHAQEHLAGHLGECATVYDVTDDWTELEPDSPTGALVRQQDAALCGKADAVIVCSQRLLELKSALHPCVRLIPNGVDVSHYRHVNDGTLPAPTTTESWERPIFGYTGTVHPARVDVSLIKDVAARLDKGTLAFVGPNHLRADEQQLLLSTGRVVFTGAVPYSDIPSWMGQFDACMVPHLVSAFTESLNPIKLWEYLAAGKPVVATPVAGFRDFPELVHLASTSAEFAKALPQVAMSPGKISAEGPRVASLHSWDQRIHEVEELLREITLEQRPSPQPAHAMPYRSPIQPRPGARTTSPL